MVEKLDDSDINMRLGYMDSPIGKLCLKADSKGLTSLQILKPAQVLMSAEPQKNSPIIDEAIKQLQAYFSGQLKIFDLPLAIAGTDFQQKVWKALEQIPYGETISYLTLAKRLGDPKTIRAAGTANGRNPIGIIIPCHRVIGSDGSLVGYAGGLEAKRWLLNHEAKNSPGLRQAGLFD